MGSHGHRVDLDAAHSHATRFNELERLGTVGTVFHPCCLLETTTIAFHIRMLPSAPAGALWSGLDITRLVPGPGKAGATPGKSLRAHSALRILTILRIRESGFSALSPEIRRRTPLLQQAPSESAIETGVLGATRCAALGRCGSWIDFRDSTAGD